MHRFKEIAERETGAKLRLFWVCEAFELKDGYHLHGLMSVESKNGRVGELFDQTDSELFKTLIDSYQVAAGSKKDKHTGKFDRFHRVQFRRYNPKMAGGKYCLKYVLKEQGKRIEADYDLLI